MRSGEKTRRVFVLEPFQNVNISMALEHGLVVPIFNPREVSAIARQMWDTPTFSSEILKRLDAQNYDPDSDFLLVAGHTAPLAMFIATVVGNWEGVQLLLWSSHFQKYVARQF